MKENPIVKTDGGAEFPLSCKIISYTVQWAFAEWGSPYLNALIKVKDLPNPEGRFLNFGELISAHNVALEKALQVEEQEGREFHKAWVENCTWKYRLPCLTLIEITEDKVVVSRKNEFRAVVWHDHGQVSWAEAGYHHRRLLSFADTMNRNSGVPFMSGSLDILVENNENPDCRDPWDYTLELPTGGEIEERVGDELINPYEGRDPYAARPKSYPALRPYGFWHGTYVGTVHMYPLGYYTRKGDPKRSRVARRRSRSLRLARRLKSETTER